ncbi:hypothetical protein R0381_000181 [Jeongeupia wiesaeckerbachi]|uniref:hypothetical protein n=1 Tax=Jeongeupia wiesaeckerbachi TaxID=3051218 RepID=UPI003D8023DB
MPSTSMIKDDADGIVLQATRNNAQWCDAVCRAHGLDSVLGDDVWASPRRTPPYYPDAVTLAPTASEASVLARIDTGNPGSSVKDSFSRLDLAPAGFEILFDAQWIHRPANTSTGTPAAAASATPLEWRRITSAIGLADWETAWGGAESTGLFRPALLTEEIAFLAALDASGHIVAGAAANRTGDVVGLSNVFATDGIPADLAWRGSLALIATLWPGQAVVGYESGADLHTAIRHGFRPVGPLRIWLQTS